MRVLRVGLAAVAVVASLGGAFAAPALAQRTVYTGQWLCDDRGSIEPLAGMNVELWKRGDSFWPVEWSGRRVARGYTDSEGKFSFTSPPDNDNYFVRMVLRDASGVHLKDFWGINDWSVDSGQYRNDRPTRTLPGLLLSKRGKSHKCAIWSGVHQAYEEYRRDVGSALPVRGIEIKADAITAGVPFTPYKTMWWPGDFPVGYSGAGDNSITHHEFAHVVRHRFDGSEGHFFGDVVHHNYLQNHAACNHTGFGFAFNEGWAEYWARDFGPAPDCGRPGDMQTEGNVAAALTELEHKCAGDQRGIMVDVLRRNPGTIHSYAEFAEKLGCPVPLLTPVPGIVAAFSAPVVVPVSDAKRAAMARKELLGTVKRVRGLRVMLRKSTRRAIGVPRCLKHPCLTALRRLTQPAGLQMELALARIHLGAVKKFDTKKEQRRLRRMKLTKLVKWSGKLQRTVQRKALAAARGATQRALAKGRRIFKSDHSKVTRLLKRALARAKGRFRRAAKHIGSLLPAVLPTSLGPIQKPRKVPIREFPSPSPTPTPTPPVDNRAASTLTIACPAAKVESKPIEVSGKLTPAVANSDLKVTFSRVPTPEPVVQSVKTDANGDWKASYEPSPNYPGSWDIKVEFAGDANRKASSANCSVEYQ